MIVYVTDEQRYYIQELTGWVPYDGPIDDQVDYEEFERVEDLNQVLVQERLEREHWWR